MGKDISSADRDLFQYDQELVDRSKVAEWEDWKAQQVADKAYLLLKSVFNPLLPDNLSEAIGEQAPIDMQCISDLFRCGQDEQVGKKIREISVKYWTKRAFDKADDEIEVSHG